MGLKAQKCTQCGAKIEINEYGKAVCPYCGTAFLDGEASKRSEEAAKQKRLQDEAELLEKATRLREEKVAQNTRDYLDSQKDGCYKMRRKEFLTLVIVIAAIAIAVIVSSITSKDEIPLFMLAVLGALIIISAVDYSNDKKILTSIFENKALYISAIVVLSCCKEEKITKLIKKMQSKGLLTSIVLANGAISLQYNDTSDVFGL